MTLEIIAKLLQFEEAFFEYCLHDIQHEGISINDNPIHRRINLSLSQAYLEIIENYHRDTTSSDNNYFEEDTINDIVRKFNKITGSNITL